MDEKPSLSDAVDTTDCLEAIGAFKAMKNLFFVITFIALVVLQGIFWLNYLGYIDVSRAFGEVVKDVSTKIEEPGDAVETEPGVTEKPEITATIKEQASSVVSGLAEGEKESDTAAAEETVPAEKAEKTEKAEKQAPDGVLAKYMPKYGHAYAVIKLCNFVLVFSATIYCLILLMSIKISLIGRLGGISHISKAFFLSLIALVILLPWQGLFEDIVLGAIYLPDELLSKFVLTDESTLVDKILYFARYSGMWGVTMLLLLAAQARSAKWSKTTLRRLGILR